MLACISTNREPFRKSNTRKLYWFKDSFAASWQLTKWLATETWSRKPSPSSSSTERDCPRNKEMLVWSRSFWEGESNLRSITVSSRSRWRRLTLSNEWRLRTSRRGSFTSGSTTTWSRRQLARFSGLSGGTSRSSNELWTGRGAWSSTGGSIAGCLSITNSLRLAVSWR